MSVMEQVAQRIEAAAALDPLARFVRSQGHRLLVEPRAVGRALSGDWFGHPIHPVAAQVPLGAWLMAVLLDLRGPQRHAEAVDTLLLTGCLAAVPTAATGLHDLATTSGASTRVGFVHAATMDVTLGLFAVAWVKRRRGDRGTARRLALAGAATAGIGAYLGGHLVFRRGVGVS